MGRFALARTPVRHTRASNPPVPSARRRAEAVLSTCSLRLRSRPFIVWPADDRARQVADALAADPADDRDAAAWARGRGWSAPASARCPDCSWPRPAAASADGEPDCGSAGTGATRIRDPVTVVAHRVDYRTASAFVAAFRRELSVSTPSAPHPDPSPRGGAGSPASSGVGCAVACGSGL